MKLVKKVLKLLYVFLLYFSLCAFILTCSFLLFFRDIEIPKEQISAAALATFFNIVFLTVLFVTLDAIRRKIMVDRPVEKIKEALSGIKKGDFSVRLDPGSSKGNFSEIMQNYGTMIQQPGLPEEKRIEYAKAITDAGRRLTDLITNILKLNRLENQQIFSAAQEYDLGEQLCQSLLQFETVWEKKNIDLETDIEESIRVCADEELLSLVWNNLLSNAFKFTENGGTVSVSLSADEHYATVRIRDTGCGMKPEVGAHIFEKFYQGDTSHSMQGNGLGLALVKRVVDIVHGEIKVESICGAGSTFTVVIPRNQNGEMGTNL